MKVCCCFMTMKLSRRPCLGLAKSWNQRLLMTVTARSGFVYVTFADKKSMKDATKGIEVWSSDQSQG